MDVAFRPSANPRYTGRAFWSNMDAWWGFHYKDLLEEPKPREVITIYEIDTTGARSWAEAVYSYRWTPQTDPHGVVHRTIDYPRGAGGPPHRRGAPRRAARRAGSGAASLRHDRAGPRRGGLRQHDPAALGRRQHRRLAYRQGRDHVLPGGGARCAALRGRPARLAGRFRAMRHRDRVLADRYVPAHLARASPPRGHAARRARLPAAGDCDRVGDTRLQLPALPQRPGPGCPAERVHPVLGRPRDARRLPQGAPVPDDRARAQRGRGHLAAL